MCDNTTKFLKWIPVGKKKPHLLKMILICTSHLTRIAWQKLQHTKYFSSQRIYKEFYKLLVRAISCSSLALGYVIQLAIVLWLCNQEETHSAEWFKKYWTGDRGNQMLAHCEINCMNNNNGTESILGGLKKAVCGTAGGTSSLPVQSDVPSLLCFFGDKSKEEASHWRSETK